MAQRVISHRELSPVFPYRKVKPQESPGGAGSLGDLVAHGGASSLQVSEPSIDPREAVKKRREYGLPLAHWHTSRRSSSCGLP